MGEGEEFVVLFNHKGELETVWDLETDAEKVVVRVREGAVEHAAVRGSRLKWRGSTLPVNANL